MRNESYLIIDYYHMELKEIYFDGCCSMVRRFPQRLCEQTLYYFGNFLPNKTVEKRERNFRNLGNEEYRCHELKTSQID